MNKKYFIDTSYLIALLNRGDKWHDAAIYWKNEIVKNNINLVTTEYILVEIADGLASLKFRRQAEQTILFLRASQNIDIIPASMSLFEKGLEIYKGYSDKEWGLTDCISFAVMKAHDITDVLSADKHFKQAGFAVLLQDQN